MLHRVSSLLREAYSHLNVKTGSLHKYLQFCFQVFVQSCLFQGMLLARAIGIRFVRFLLHKMNIFRF